MCLCLVLLHHLCEVAALFLLSSTKWAVLPITMEIYIENPDVRLCVFAGPQTTGGFGSEREFTSNRHAIG